MSYLDDLVNAKNEATSNVAARRQICKKLAEQYDTRMNILKSSSGLISDKINDYTASVINLSNDDFTSDSELSENVDNYLNQCAEEIPNLSGGVLDTMDDIIAACPFLANNHMFSDKAALIYGMTLTLLDSACEIANIFSSGLPEFAIGLALSGIDDLFESLSLSTIISEMSMILVCLENICGEDTTERAEELDEFLTEHNIDNDGNFDYVAKSQSLGLGFTESNFSKIRNINQTMKDVKNTVANQINKASGLIESSKQTITGGFDFGPWSN